MNFNLTKSKVIKLNEIADLQRLIDEASKVEGEVLLQHGYYIVNGKSILGVMSLDLTKGVNVIYPADEVIFEQFIEQFEVEV